MRLPSLMTAVSPAPANRASLEAVTRGLTTRWSSGPIEGRVSHIKTVKRQMYGRAGRPLLRYRAS